jgi:hypothetical protein
MNRKPEKVNGDRAPSPAPFPFPTAERHPASPAVSTQPAIEVPTEDALDHGIEESFPASDPVSVSVTKAVPKPVDSKASKDGVKPS